MASIAIGAHAALAAAPVRCAHTSRATAYRTDTVPSQPSLVRSGTAWHPMWSPPMSQPNQRMI